MENICRRILLINLTTRQRKHEYHITLFSVIMNTEHRFIRLLLVKYELYALKVV